MIIIVVIMIIKIIIIVYNSSNTKSVTVKTCIIFCLIKLATLQVCIHIVLEYPLHSTLYFSQCFRLLFCNLLFFKRYLLYPTTLLINSH